MRWSLVAITAMLINTAMLTSCGGGSSTQPQIAPAAHRAVKYGYYGTWDNTQISETYGHVNMVMAFTIEQMQQAQQRGLDIIVMPWLYIGNGQTTDRGDAVLVPDPRAADILRAQFADMQNAGVKPVGMYPVDEPDLHGLTDAQVCSMNSLIRSIAAEQHIELKLLVIYGDRGAPCLAGYDAIGTDDYTDPQRAFDRLDAYQLRPDQQRILVPGGACPWLNDTATFLRKAENDTTVGWVIPFIWADQYAGTSNCGIRSAKTRAAYEALGTTLTK